MPPAGMFSRRGNSIGRWLNQPLAKPGQYWRGKPGSREAGKPGSREAGKPGSREAGKPGSREAGKPGSREAGKPRSREAEKPGIPVVQVSSRESFRTCSKCGNVGKEPRKNQARFECFACGCRGNAAANAAAVLAFRVYQQQVDRRRPLGCRLKGGGTILLVVSVSAPVSGSKR